MVYRVLIASMLAALPLEGMFQHLGVERVSLDAAFPPEHSDLVLKHLRILHTELRRANRMTAVAAMLKRNPVKNYVMVGERNGFDRDGYRVYGWYDDGTIEVYVVDRPLGDLRGTIHHELGHHLYDSGIREAWDELYERHGATWWGEQLPYGELGPSEAFAQSFERYMVGGRLPEPARRFLVNLAE